MKTVPFLALLMSLAIVSLQAANDDSNLDKNDNASTHIVVKGETLFAISRNYNVTVDALMHVNPGIPENFLISVGEQLTIPDPQTNAIVKAKKPDCEVVKCRYHIVQPGETLYSISKMYDDVSVENIIALNGMKSAEISIGQEIIVKVLEYEEMKVEQLDEKRELWAKARKRQEAEGVPSRVAINRETTDKVIEAQKRNESAEAIIDEYEEIFKSYQERDLAIKQERVTANYLDESFGKDSYYALYDGSEVGSVLKVRNVINNNIVYLKVLGTVPEKDQDESVQLKISKSAASELVALDNKFVLEVTAYEVQ